MGLISKFVSSKFSGYALIALLIAGAGAGYWFWSELKEFGSLEAKAENQAVTIASQQAQIEELARLNQQRQAAITKQNENLNALKRSAQLQRQELRGALNEASEKYIDCRDMVVPQRLRFGPSRQDGATKD